VGSCDDWPWQRGGQRLSHSVKARESALQNPRKHDILVPGSRAASPDCTYHNREPSCRRKPMQTLKELKKYLDDECYNGVIIGKYPIDNCAIIWQEGDGYFFGYSERGRISVVKKFDTEKELVAYALGKLENDIWAKAHLAAWTWTEKDIQAAEQELERRQVPFKRNDIPNFDIKHGKAYRIFVFGKDILRLSDFKKKYLQQYL